MDQAPRTEREPTRPKDARLARARNATFAAFAINGALYAGFLSRVPDIKHQLELSTGRLSLALLALSFGAVIGLPLAGRVVWRWGTARTVAVAGSGMALGVLAVGLATTVLGSAAALTAALALVGVSTGMVDVAMNLQGAEVERRLGRAIMPWFHAAFSAGTVVSALLGALASFLAVPVLWHVCVVVLAFVPVARIVLRDFLPDPEPEHGGSPHAVMMAEWRRPTTLLIGVVVLAAAFTEGTANDWLAVALADGYDLPRWLGVLGFAAFLSAMTAGRILGPSLLDRWGRVTMLRALFALAILGCLLVVFGGPVLAFAGAICWGLGASLGFPVGMSAAADDPARAAARMSVVSTIGYAAFIAGPPLLGFLGEHGSLLHALLVVGAAALVALLLVPVVREPEPRPDASPTNG